MSHGGGGKPYIQEFNSRRQKADKRRGGSREGETVIGKVQVTWPSVRLR